MRIIEVVDEHSSLKNNRDSWQVSVGYKHKDPLHVNLKFCPS
jgi:hypothetical protein